MDNQRKMVKLDQYYNIFTWLKMVLQKALPIFSNCHRQVLTVFLPVETLLGEEGSVQHTFSIRYLVV